MLAARLNQSVSVGQDESASLDKSNLRDPVSVAPSGFSISGAAFAQDQLYTNGGLNYTLRGYATVAGAQNTGAAQTNGELLQHLAGGNSPKAASGVSSSHA